MFDTRYRFTSERFQKKPEELQALYRSVFGDVKGQIVLTDILIDLCMWDEIETSEGVSEIEKLHLSNAAKKILRKCGVLCSENAELITKALMKMPMQAKRKKK